MNVSQCLELSTRKVSTSQHIEVEKKINEKENRGKTRERNEKENKKEIFLAFMAHSFQFEF